MYCALAMLFIIFASLWIFLSFILSFLCKVRLSAHTALHTNCSTDGSQQTDSVTAADTEHCYCCCKWLAERLLSRTSLNDFLWMPLGSFTRAISPQSDWGQSPSQPESLCYTIFKSISVSIPPITTFFSLLVIQMKQSLIGPFGSGAIFCSGYYELLWFLNYYSKFMVRTTFPLHSSI